MPCKHRKHTPIKSEAQRRLFGAAMSDSRKAPSLGKAEARRHLKEVAGKDLLARKGLARRARRGK